MKIILLFAAGLFIALTSHAQNTFYHITGKILDEKQQPLSFATITLNNAQDSSLVKGEMTDETGSFKLDHIAEGDYLIIISYLGYHNYSLPLQLQHATDLGNIVLVPAAASLNAVTVQGNRPVVQHENDKIILNVEASSILSGGSAWDALEKAPGVTTDNNDNLSLRGKQHVLVMIDDKPTYLSSEQLANQLKAMPADALARIEVITNPSARYDAEGNAGIINIVTRKNKDLGFSGDVHGSASLGKMFSPGAGMLFNDHHGKVNLFGNYDFYNYRRVKEVDIRRNFDDEGIASLVTENSSLEVNDMNHSAKLGVDYFINSRNTIGFVASGFSDPFKMDNTTAAEVSNSDGSYVPSSITSGTLNDLTNNYAFNVNYEMRPDTLGTSLTANLDYAQFNSNGNDIYTTDYYDTSGGFTGVPLLYNIQKPGILNIRSAKIDFTHPLRHGFQLEAGVKASSVKNDNEEDFLVKQQDDWFLDTTLTDHFIYTETIYAGYLQGSKKLGKWEFQAGLRGEYTHASGNSIALNENFVRNYFQLFPSATITNHINSKNSISLSYSRRIDRPQYQDLNPFTFFLDPFLFEQGNPNVKPQLTHSVELNYLYNQTYAFTLSYDKTTDEITELFYQNDSTKTTILQSDNFGCDQVYAATVYAPIQLLKRWNLTPVVTAFYEKLQTMYLDNEFDRQFISCSVNLQNSFTLPKGFYLDVSAKYQSPLYWSLAHLNAFGDVSAGAKKSFANGKATLKLAVTDIFNTDVRTGNVIYSNLNSSFDQNNDRRQVKMSFSYHFGKAKAIERHRGNSIEEEESRVKSGGG